MRDSRITSRCDFRLIIITLHEASDTRILLEFQLLVTAINTAGRVWGRAVSSRTGSEDSSCILVSLARVAALKRQKIRDFHRIHNVVDHGVLQTMWEEWYTGV